MSPRTKLSIGLCCAVSVLAGAVAAEAQVGRFPQPKPSRVEADGTIEALAPTAVQILTLTNQKWVFQFTRETKVQVTGTAKADFLRPGLFVEFTADLNTKGRAAEKLGELTIFTPFVEKDNARLPGIAPAAAGAEGFGQAAAPAAKKDPNATVRYLVRGRITAIKNAAMTVAAGRAVVRVELTDDPKISVDVADLSLARKGDKASIRGQSLQEGFGRASQITVELAEPLTAAKHAGAKPAERPERPKREPRTPRKGPGEKPEEKPAAEEAPAVEEKTAADQSGPPAAEVEPDSAAASEPREDHTAEIVGLLRLGPEKAQARPPVRMLTGGEGSALFSPSKAEPLAKLEPLLGKPDETRTIEGMMAPPEGGPPQYVKLKVVVRGGVTLFVDQQGTVRYYHAAKSP